MGVAHPKSGCRIHLTSHCHRHLFSHRHLSRPNPKPPDPGRGREPQAVPAHRFDRQRNHPPALGHAPPRNSRPFQDPRVNGQCERSPVGFAREPMTRRCQEAVIAAVFTDTGFYRHRFSQTVFTDTDTTGIRSLPSTIIQNRKLLTK